MQISTARSEPPWREVAAGEVSSRKHRLKPLHSATYRGRDRLADDVALLPVALETRDFGHKTGHKSRSWTITVGGQHALGRAGPHTNTGVLPAERRQTPPHDESLGDEKRRPGGPAGRAERLHPEPDVLERVGRLRLGHDPAVRYALVQQRIAKHERFRFREHTLGPGSEPARNHDALTMPGQKERRRSARHRQIAAAEDKDRVARAGPMRHGQIGPYRFQQLG